MYNQSACGAFVLIPQSHHCSFFDAVHLAAAALVPLGIRPAIPSLLFFMLSTPTPTSIFILFFLSCFSY